MDQLRILVIGGTGTVGSQVVHDLLTKKADVSVLTRDPGKAAQQHRGVHVVEGDLLEPSTVRGAFSGMEGVFMLNAVSPTETHEGLMALNGARLAGVKRFVYMTIHALETAPHLPHFGSKISVEFALKASGIPCTLLRPNNFYQNDYWFQEPMLKYGIYPQPIGHVGISRVDVRDIAEAAAIVLTSNGHEGKTYNLVGPQALTGMQTAEIWSRTLGKPIVYGSEDMDAWEKQAAQMMPAWAAFDLRLMYEVFQKQGLKATPAELADISRLLGHPPRRFEDFAMETARAWKSSNRT